jgi:hypothetical protein
VQVDERVQRAVERLVARLAHVVKVPPPVKTRWLERLWARGEELGLTGDGTEPTAEQIDALLDELVQAEKDVQGVAPAEATGVVRPAVGIVEAAAVAPDDEGHHATVLPLPRIKNGVHQ